MPSHEYAFLSESDLHAVSAYIKSLPSVDKPNGPIKLGPVAKVLIFLGEITTFLPAEIIDHKKPMVSKPEEVVSSDFGRYLVESACVGCHGAGLQGGPIPGGDPDWPHALPLTESHLASWSFEDFRKAMQEGFSKTTGEKLRLPMPIALTSQLDEKELKSMWMFLSKKSLSH